MMLWKLMRVINNTTYILYPCTHDNNFFCHTVICISQPFYILGENIMYKINIILCKHNTKINHLYTIFLFTEIVNG